MLSAAIDHGVLVIDGTRRSDTIVVIPGKRAVTVHMNLETFEFSLRTFQAIRIRGGEANDLIAVGTYDNPCAVAASVSAGAGDDTVAGGAGNDTISGDDGRDVIIGAAGDDLIHGGQGRDDLYGGDGNDTIFGENSYDHISGDRGNDSLSGGTGDDIISDGIGIDTVYGNGGRDRFSYADSDTEFKDVEPGDFIGPTNLDIEQIVRSGSGADVWHLVLLDTIGH